MPALSACLPAGEPLLTKETVEHVTQIVAQHGSDAWWEMEIADLLPEALRAGERALPPARVLPCPAWPAAPYFKPQPRACVWRVVHGVVASGQGTFCLGV